MAEGETVTSTAVDHKSSRRIAHAIIGGLPISHVCGTVESNKRTQLSILRGLNYEDRAGHWCVDRIAPSCRSITVTGATALTPAIAVMGTTTATATIAVIATIVVTAIGITANKLHSLSIGKEKRGASRSVFLPITTA